MGRVPGSAGDRTVLGQVAAEGRDVQPVGVEDAAADVGDRHDAGARLVEQPRRRFADVAEPLDRDPRARACGTPRRAAASSMM